MHTDREQNNGITPYFIIDKSYLLMLWLLVMHRDEQLLRILESMFNKSLSQRRSVLKNAFALIKESWHEMIFKSNFHMNIILDVFYPYYIPYNIIMNNNTHLEHLMIVLEQERDKNKQCCNAHSKMLWHEILYNRRLE